MAELYDLTHVRRLREFQESISGMCTRSHEIPQCQLIKDFLKIHGLPWHAPMVCGAIPRELLRELREAMQVLHQKVMAEQRRLCVEFGVLSPSALPHDVRVFYDAQMRTFMNREDHYP